MDTIFALASGQPPAGICVIRVSGPLCQQMCLEMVGSVPLPRSAKLCSIRDRNKEIIDEGLCLYFPAPHSFTGEDCLEFQVHGSMAVVRDLTTALGSFVGARPALAGEFAQRAFMNGQFDLTEAEGLADLIAAETSQQRRLALRQSQGEVSAAVYRWKEQLLEMRALLEASIDFADEDDIAQDVELRVAEQVQVFVAQIDQYLSSVAPSEAIRRGLLVVLAGPPNAGKSSLFNAIVGSDRVIVSPVAGTTRDYVEERLDLNGYLVRLVDTAGLRVAEDVLEEEGIARSRALVDRADIVLELSDEVKFELAPSGPHQTVVRLASKGDLHSFGRGPADLVVSTLDANSVGEVTNLIVDLAKEKFEFSAGFVPVNERQADFLRTVKNVVCSVDFMNDPVEVRADALWRANDALGRIVGSHNVEDVLGAVFSRFCIGK